MRNLCVRVEEETYEQVSDKAKEMRVSLSDFMRKSLHAMCNNGACNQEDSSAELKPTLQILHSQLCAKDMQLERKEVQLEQLFGDLSEQNKRHDTIVMQLTQQLDRSLLMLEDLRKRRSVWQKIRDVFVAEAG